jgi:hypothetical protein
VTALPSAIAGAGTPSWPESWRASIRKFSYIPGLPRSTLPPLPADQPQQAYEPHGFTQIELGWVADVVLYSPRGRSRSDATKNLGGIADVLKHKARRGLLDHLGELANVWVYRTIVRSRRRSRVARSGRIRQATPYG